MMNNGSATVKMTDIAAKTSVRYVTTGWLVHREPRFGNPTSSSFGTIHHAKSEYSFPNPPIPGKSLTSFFSISEQDLRQALLEAGMINLRHDDVLYVSAIFQVMDQQMLLPKKYLSHKEIATARKWANPASLQQYYDIQVRFDSAMYPSYVELKSTNGVILKQALIGNYAAGATVNHVLPSVVVHEGKTFSLQRSYVLSGTKRILQAGHSVMTRTIIQPVGGFQLIAEFEPLNVTKTALPKETVQWISYQTDIENRMIIGSNQPGLEQYDVRSGIPAGEPVYVHLRTPSYILEGTFAKVSGTKIHDVPITKMYRLRWSEYNPATKMWESRLASESIKLTVPVPRTYEYWRAERVGLYALQDARILNNSLPGGAIQWSAATPTLPDTRLLDHPTHVQPWTPSEIKLQTVDLDNGKAGKPTIPSEDYVTEASKHIPELQCRNDLMIIAGQSIMDDHWAVASTKEPGSLEHLNINNQLFDKRIYTTVKNDASNGAKPSKGHVTYRLLHALGDNVSIKTISSDAHDVMIHTPLIQRVQMESDGKAVQMVKKDTLPHLALGTQFDIQLLHAGSHRAIPGFGTRDYQSYIAARTITFPFDVFIGNLLLPKHKPISLASNETKVQFRIPEWIPEGVYTIEALAKSNACLTTVCTAQPDANVLLQHGNVSSSLKVRVIGRVFGFRRTDSIKKLPQISPLGDYIHFRVSTVGDYTDITAGLKITSTFYFIRRGGTNREPIVVYYENDEGRFVKFGSMIQIPASKRTFDGPVDYPKSIQQWVGAFRLPTKLKIVSTTSKETLSLKDGLIIVNFAIETIKNNRWDEPILSYYSSDKWNQWAIEQWPASVKWNDYYLQLLPGDVLLYDGIMKRSVPVIPRISN